MKKKIFTLLTLLMCVVSGAWAQTTLFLWQYDGQTTYGDKSNGEFAMTATTGTAKFVTYEGKQATPGMSWTSWDSSITDSDLKPSAVSTKKKTLKLGNNAAHIKITPSSGNFKAGDIIYICGYCPFLVTTTTVATPSSTAHIVSASGVTTIAASVATGTASNNYIVGSVTLPNDFVETNAIYISRVQGGSSVGVAAIKVVRPKAKTVTSKVLTGININGSAWDIAGLTDNAATISTAQKGLPLVEFVYTINYDEGDPDTNQKETVAATKSGSNYVAASTVLGTNVTLTFTDVQPYIFNMTEVTGPTTNVIHGTGVDITANFNDVANTSAYGYNGHGSNDEVVLVYNTNYITLNSSGNSYFKPTFAIALAEGDVINCSNTAASTFKVGTSTSNGSATTVTFPYVIPANSGLIGKKTFYMFKTGSGGTPEFTTFSIVRNPKHSVTYSIGAGTGTAPTQADVPETATFTVASGSGFTAPSGKAFSCWNDGTNDYAAGATYTMGTEDVTLTAVYETAITAAFANGGHGTAPDAQVTTGSVVLSPIKVDWYENETWVADRDVEVDDATVTAGTAIAAGKTAIMSENTTFTAQWTYTGKPYVEGIAFATPATNALDLTTQTLFTPSNGYVVLNPNSVRGNNTTGYWMTTRNGNKVGFKWTAPEGSVFYSNNGDDNENAVVLQQQKTYAMKFTGTTEFKALMNSRKDGTSNKVKVMLVDYNGATPEKVGDVIEIGNFGNGTAELTNDAIASFSGLDASHTYTAFLYGYDTGTNAVLYEVAFQIPVPATPTTSGDETYLTTSDNMAGWRAFYDASNSYSVDANTKVYVADADPVGSTITLKSIDGIPANVPVILHTSSSADSHKMTLTKETVSPFSYTGTNKLEYTTSAVSNKYRLGFGASGVGFYPYSGTPASGAVILNASSAAARAITISFEEDELTGISLTPALSEGEGAIYNLRGQRVAQPTKGLYIVNGKKVVMK